MKFELNLNDSQFIKGKGKPIEDCYTTGIYCQAVDKLNNEIAEGSIQTYSLSSKYPINIFS